MGYWVLDRKGYNAEIEYDKDTVTLSNGLVSRKIETDGCRTVSFRNEGRDTEFIDSPYPGFAVSVNGVKYMADEGFAFKGLDICDPEERVPFVKSPTMAADCVYPPAGKAAVLRYVNSRLGIEADVRYEIYDGIPVIMKSINVRNTGDESIVIDNIYTDIMKISRNRDELFVDSDFDSTTDFLGLDINRYAKRYARYIYGVLEAAPEYRMNVRLEKGAELGSITVFELAFTAEYYEQRLIEVKAMYRIIAPWCTDNVMFFHLISDDPEEIRKAVDECEETGLEMIIQSFGSEVDMESSDEKYLARVKKDYDYAHSKGIRIGGYTLAYVKDYDPVNGDEAINHDYSHICRCLATEWSDKYMKSIVNFLDKTGADAIEIDGPYGMQLCSGGKTHLHDDFTDSQYKQWKASVHDWYREIKLRGIYINAPDWHYMNGTNRQGVGYEEIAFSEARQEQLITSRIYYYKGTFSKNPSQGWGFLPLDVYHGGGDKAKFFPTEKNAFEFDWAMAQIAASGVWPTLRGTYVYDSETGKNILKKWVSIYKRYRNVVNGITVHFMPPVIDKNDPSRTTDLDAIMNLLPYGEDRGFLMFFNQTDREITKEVSIPVYYSGLTGALMPPAPVPGTKNSDVEYPVYGIESAPLVIKARDGRDRHYVTDTAVIDKEIPELPVPSDTERTVIFSEEDRDPAEYTIDSNCNVKMKITLKPMSYRWFVLHPGK